MALLGTDSATFRRPAWPVERLTLQVATVIAFDLVVLIGALALWPEGIGPGVWLAALAAYALGSGLAVAGVRRGYPHRVLGLCNAVTHLRATLVVFLAAALVAGAAAAPLGWALTGIAAAVLALDGADGWLARRRGLVSRFGARFDVETDAVFAAVLAAAALSSGKIGWPEAVVLGAARYAFQMAGLGLPWLRAPLPERLRRKAICVLQLSVLVVLLAPAADGAAARLAGVAAALAVVASFALDIRTLWRQRRG
ncbi:CDP-alcohol phosphatidyltransferase family protein [Rhodosalinus sp.]|uniref:CDP-alcohol phosphatidyltransferase family protein n=1 Tax=Rhodosalinus sp. TaxID=2047741 RepID=UPI003978214D